MQILKVWCEYDLLWIILLLHDVWMNTKNTSIITKCFNNQKASTLYHSLGYSQILHVEFSKLISSLIQPLHQCFSNVIPNERLLERLVKTSQWFHESNVQKYYFNNPANCYKSTGLLCSPGIIESYMTKKFLSIWKIFAKFLRKHHQPRSFLQKKKLTTHWFRQTQG